MLAQLSRSIDVEEYDGAQAQSPLGYNTDADASIKALGEVQQEYSITCQLPRPNDATSCWTYRVVVASNALNVDLLLREYGTL